IGRLARAGRNLDHVGRAIAGGELHHARPVAARIDPHRLRVDRHRPAIAGRVRQVTAMQADGHGAPGRINARNELTRCEAGAQEIIAASRTLVIELIGLFGAVCKNVCQCCYASPAEFFGVVEALLSLTVTSSRRPSPGAYFTNGRPGGTGKAEWPQASLTHGWRPGRGGFT